MIRVGKGVEAVRCGGAERGVSEVAKRVDKVGLIGFEVL